MRFKYFVTLPVCPTLHITPSGHTYYTSPSSPSPRFDDLPRKGGRPFSNPKNELDGRPVVDDILHSMTTYRFDYSPLQRLLWVLLYMTEIGFGLLTMLCAMSFNGYVFLTLLLGEGLGYAIWGSSDLMRILLGDSHQH